MLVINFNASKLIEDTDRFNDEEPTEEFEFEAPTEEVLYEYTCNRCGERGGSAFSCWYCGWGDLYPASSESEETVMS